MENFSSQERAVVNPAEKKAEIKQETCDRLQAMREGMGPMEKQIIDRLFSCEPRLENKKYVVAVQMALSQVMKTSLSLDGVYGEKTDLCLENFCQTYEAKYGEKVAPDPLGPQFPRALKRALEDPSFQKEQVASKPRVPAAQVSLALAQSLAIQVDDKGVLRKGESGLVDRYALTSGQRLEAGEAPVLDPNRPDFGMRMAIYFPRELGLKMGNAPEMFGKTKEEMGLLNDIFRSAYLVNPAKSGALVNFEDPAYQEARNYGVLSKQEQDRLADKQYAWSLKVSSPMLKSMLVLDEAEQAKITSKLSEIFRDVAKIDTKLKAMELTYKNKTESSFSTAVVESHRKDFMEGSLALWNQIINKRAELAKIIPTGSLDQALGKMLHYQLTRLELRYGADPNLALRKDAFLKALQTAPKTQNERV